MSQQELYLSLVTALGAGLLIGFEREQSTPREEDASGQSLGGVRTHPLVALLGACCMLLSAAAGAAVVVLGLLGVAAFLVVSYAGDVRRNGDRGLTSEFAFLLSFLLGALALGERIVQPTSDRLLAVGAIAVVVTLLLSVKPALHAFTRHASREDVFATLKFLVVSVVVLPQLPDRGMGPLAALNPRSIGYMVVLIAGISFVGYVAIRTLGARRGMGVTGLVGGLASSTAVTLSMSSRARSEPRLAGTCALAVVLASTIMFGRVVLEVSVVNPPLVRTLLWPLGVMTAAGVLAAVALYFASPREAAAGDVKLSNPFELSSALKFAAVFAAVMLVAKAATTYLGTGATYLTGLLAGATDVDAITLSMARLARDQVSHDVAATTILIAVGSNTLVKAGLAVGLGGWAFGRRIALALAVALVAGAVGLTVVRLS